ncbi:MAG: HAMP domain-containing histidine kinase [Nitrospirae bacterium]|nr:HAMP domain-containing histidine kinase [Nitrospirota bacterium]
MEDELHELNSTLEQRVVEETNKRRAQEYMLIQNSKMAAMGEMMAAIAHQWKQPLSTLAILVQDIIDAYEYGELDDAYIRTTVGKSMSQIQFMSKTIEDFSNFFKPSSKKETCDIIKIASDVLAMLTEQLKNNSISYSITCHSPNRTGSSTAAGACCKDAVITTYRSQFAHVLLNIINNAKDAIINKKRSGLPDAKEDGMISLDFYKEGDMFKLLIRDNGGGIPEHIIDRIFEPRKSS